MTGFRQNGIELSDISGSPNVITNTSVIFTDGQKHRDEPITVWS